MGKVRHAVKGNLTGVWVNLSSPETSVGDRLVLFCAPMSLLIYDNLNRIFKVYEMFTSTPSTFPWSIRDLNPKLLILHLTFWALHHQWCRLGIEELWWKNEKNKLPEIIVDGRWRQAIMSTEFMKVNLCVQQTF